MKPPGVNQDQPHSPGEGPEAPGRSIRVGSFIKIGEGPPPLGLFEAQLGKEIEKCK